MLDLAQEMYPPHVDPRFNLSQKDVLPSRSRGRAGTIRYLVAAYNDHLGIRKSRQYRWERTHEDVIAPQWLQIARYKGYNLIAEANDYFPLGKVNWAFESGRAVPTSIPSWQT